MPRFLFLLLLFASCSVDTGHKKEKEKTLKNDADSLAMQSPEQKDVIAIDDTLTTLAGLIAGNIKETALFPGITENKDYQVFSGSFSKRWQSFDSTRISRLSAFRSSELAKLVKPEPTLFYPFSGPDILHAALFFPEADNYVLVGLEPVGTLPHINAMPGDSLEEYYATLNTSLNAILNFSFFRTESMKSDLRNNEVDGTIHLLFLFLNRIGNAIVSATPITLDSLGNTVTVMSFEVLKAAKLKTKGMEIRFKTPDKKLKHLYYFSTNASDYNLQSNRGFSNYLGKLDHFNVYLKGASYLLHKSTFKKLRGTILAKAETIVQDDSGIALNYFYSDTLHSWKYHLYGQYSKPIQMFAKHYQPLMDSLYRQQGARQLDFGLGYNYRDKNSNFMVITKKD